MRPQHTLPIGRFILFVLLSLADLYLTGALLQKGHGKIYEGNPIAGAWLSEYGWPGLVVFKVGALAIVSIVVVFLAVYRPSTGRRLLTFGCSVLALVALYSVYLLNSGASAERKLRFIPADAPVQHSSDTQEPDRLE
jgi:hypothetical protein